MHFDSGTLITLVFQTVAYVIAGYKYVSGLRDEINELKARLSTHERESEIRHRIDERKDDEMSQRLKRIEEMLTQIRLELKDKADRDA
jgi:predicted Holliday junction resolvase-like endonuclease